MRADCPRYTGAGGLPALHRSGQVARATQERADCPRYTGAGGENVVCPSTENEADGSSLREYFLWGKTISLLDCFVVYSTAGGKRPSLHCSGGAHYGRTH